MNHNRVIELSSHQPAPQIWGCQGENGATTLLMDISEYVSSWPAGTPAFVCQRQDGRPYLHSFERQDNMVSIVLTQTDTRFVGKIELQFNWSLPNNQIIKSCSFRGNIVHNALEGDLPLTPDAI